MTVEENAEIYQCKKCGNEVIVTNVGGGTLSCCGEEMTKINGLDVDPFEDETDEEDEESEE
ncbi:desulfoferrodoxin FeS4 iron-binding domain-containing protein [Candidatus Dojkabacteria bacterium]|nr:desulfoferrodoxin FeS4 iron-binding domain-containing protein [Candidatus Dojkabacteria bacterium]